MPQAGEPVDISNAALQELIMTGMNIRASYYTMVAGFVVYIWDILLTLKDEQELLWTKEGRFVKILYLTNRYLPFIGLLIIVYVNNPVRTWAFTDDVCKVAFIIVQFSQAIEIMVATSIFVIRIHTIYSGNILAQRLLILILTASHLTLFAFMLSACVTIADTMFYSETIQFCVGSPKNLTGGLYITPIVVESFVLFMTLFHAVHFARVRIGFDETAAGIILKTLYVDGTQYYLIVFSLRLGTTLVYYLAPESLILLMPYLEYSLTSTVTSRWFLSFRRVLLDIFSPQPTLSFAPSQVLSTGQGVTFGHLDGRPRRPLRKLDTFLSDHVTEHGLDIQIDMSALGLGFSNSTDHELQVLESSSPSIQYHVTR